MAGAGSQASKAFPAFPCALTRPLAVKANGVRCMQMFYSRGRFPLQLDRQIIANPFDPRHSECRARYRAIPATDLIVDVSANQSGGKAVQRKWAVLSIRQALFNSFAQIGLDPIGRNCEQKSVGELLERQEIPASTAMDNSTSAAIAKPIKNSTTRSSTLHRGLWEGPLTGTLAIYASPAIQKSPFRRIQKEMDLLVTSLTTIARGP